MDSQRYTFKSLFDKNDDDSPSITKSITKIEIPMIQRDYAQGRKDAETCRIRERFLDALFKALDGENPLVLDFVYGSIDGGCFIPLDGQQRLTTLFLLHWYIAVHENIDNGEYQFLGNFTYKTRFSSRDFCKNLVSFRPADIGTGCILSKQIKDQSWYEYDWKNDPTVQSMLVMIDSIHEKFNASSGLWPLLIQNGLISFYFLALEKMGLDDDLYIQMNSRGKPLTVFEHFKTEFESIIKSSNTALEIYQKLDTVWPVTFWGYEENKIVDDALMRYFKFISSVICRRSGIDFENDEFKLAETLYGGTYKKAGENIAYLEKAFDCWTKENLKSEITDFFNSVFSSNRYESEKVVLYQDDTDILKDCCQNDTYHNNKTLLLFSVITYLTNKDYVSIDDFRRRIRIIRNLVLNSINEIRNENMAALLEETKTIILDGVIPQAEKGKQGFNTAQKEEEQNKLDWLKTNHEMEVVLFELEDHVLLQGCIAVIGLENSENFGKFCLLFDHCDRDLINRALLATGDYSQDVSRRTKIGVAKNDDTWRDLFHPSQQRTGFVKTKDIINKLLSRLSPSEINDDKLTNLIEKYLYSPDTPRNLFYYFVKYQEMRNHGYGLYYRIGDNPYKVYIMNTRERLSGKNWDAFMYTLSRSSEFSGKLYLSDYAYGYDDKLQIRDADIAIENLIDSFVVYQNHVKIREIPIKQENGIDLEDRINTAKSIIREILNTKA